MKELIVLLLFLGFSGSALAQQGDLRALNPSDIYMSVYFYERDGNKALNKKDFEEAIEKFSKANELLNTLRLNFPTWNPKKIDNAFDRVGEYVRETLKEKDAVKAEATALFTEKKELSGVEKARLRADKILNNNKNLQEISAKLEAINKKIEEKEKAFTEEEQAESSRKDLFAALKRRDAELEKLKVSAAEEKKAAESRQKLLTDEVLTLKKELTAVVGTQNKTSAEAQQELRQKIANKDREIENLKQNAQAVRNENEAHQKSLHDEITALKSELVEAKDSSVLTEKLTIKENELTTLQEKLTTAETEKRRLLAEKESALKEAEETKSLLTYVEKENTTLQNTLKSKTETYEKKLTGLSAEITSLEKRHTATTASLEKEKSALATSLEKTTETLKGKITGLSNTVEGLEEEKVQTAKELAEVKSNPEVVVVEKPIPVVPASVEKELALANKASAESQKKLEKAQKEASSTKGESLQLKERLEEKEAALAALTKKLEELRAQQASTEKEKSTELTALQRTRKETTEKLQLLQQKLATAEQATLTAEKKEASFLENISLLSAALKKSQTDQEEALIALQKSKTISSSLQSEVTALKQERSILLTRPLRSEVQTLQDDLRSSSAAKSALSKNLSENEGKYYEALDRIEKLQQELETTRLATSQLEKDSSEEREIANDVIKSQRARLDTQKEELGDYKRKLAAEESRALKLQKLVDQTTEQYKEVKIRHDGLIAEHAQLKLLLNEGKSEDVLKQENAILKRELSVARSRFKNAVENEDTEREDVLIAKKQYAILRAELIKTKHNLEIANLRGDKLANHLREAEAELKIADSVNDSKYTAEEVTMLKGLLQKQLKMQENRQIARSIILEEVKRMGGDDTQVLAALDLAETQELMLSDDQKQLLANPEADGEFRFSDRATPEERKRAEAALNTRIAAHDKFGRAAYEKGHYLAAEQFFQINLEAHPGHIPSMLNLGVARLRMAESGGKAEDFQLAINSFEDALAMRGDDGLPYALEMLGYAHYKQGLDQEAAEYFLKCLSVDPSNANSHLFLASLTAEEGDLETSETHLRKALTIDATLTEPQYNLALLLTSQGKHKEALKNYREALLKGAPSDPSLEENLRKAMPEASF